MKKLVKAVLLLMILVVTAGSLSACSWAIFEPPPHETEDTGDGGH